MWAVCSKQLCEWCTNTRFANAEVDLDSAVFQLDSDDDLHSDHGFEFVPNGNTSISMGIVFS